MSWIWAHRLFVLEIFTPHESQGTFRKSCQMFLFEHWLNSCKVVNVSSLVNLKHIYIISSLRYMFHSISPKNIYILQHFTWFRTSREGKSTCSCYYNSHLEEILVLKPGGIIKKVKSICFLPFQTFQMRYKIRVPCTWCPISEQVKDITQG